MASLRDLRERKKTVSSIQKITNAMKVVSVSKFRRTQKQMLTLRPYAEKSREIFANLSAANVGAGADPYLEEREIKKICYVLFVGDKGLCGGYNNNLIRFFQKMIAEEQHEYSVVIIGKWGNDIIGRLKLPVIQRFSDVGDQPGIHISRAITAYLLSMYDRHEADKIVLVYEKFLNAVSQEPTARALLPVKKEEEGTRESSDPMQAEKKDESRSEYIFVPEMKSVLHSAVLNYIESTMFQTILEAKAGEHASRMTAMTAASDNTEALISELTLYMNRVRQADITTEISEIVGGAAALKKRQQKK